MGNEYHIYTEAKIDNKWVCINPYAPKFDKDLDLTGHNLTQTYWNGSRSYFSETFNKIKNEGYSVKYEDISDTLKKYYTEDRADIYAFAIPVNTMKKCVGNGKETECSGFVTEEAIFDYKHNGYEIVDHLTTQEYLELPEEARKLYKAFNWNNPFGWYEHFKDILAHNEFVEYAFFDTNSFIPEKTELRFVCFQW